MGLDGGTTVTRSDVLRGQSWRVASQDNSRSTRGGTVSMSAAAAPSVEKAVERDVQWSTCALSSQPLQPPIVADYLGRLYNKEALLQHLACKRGLVSDPAALLSYANQLRVAGGALDHLAGLRDVFEVHLTQAGGGAAGAGAAGALPAAAGSTAAGTMGVAAGVGAEAVGGGAGGLGDGSAGAGGEHEGDAVWVCPVTQLRCSRNATVALRPCGHVVSERAVRSLAAAADRSCPVCCKAYDSTVVLCGTAEQVAELRARLREGKGKGKGREGKEGKGKKRKAEGELDGKEAGA